KSHSEHFFFMTSIWRPTAPLLFPYTTLFRSIDQVFNVERVRAQHIAGHRLAQITVDGIGAVQCAHISRTDQSFVRFHLDKGDVADRKSTRLNSSHSQISYAVFCLKKKKEKTK